MSLSLRSACRVEACRITSRLTWRRPETVDFKTDAIRRSRSTVCSSDLEPQIRGQLACRRGRPRRRPRACKSCSRFCSSFSVDWNCSFFGSRETAFRNKRMATSILSWAIAALARSQKTAALLVSSESAECAENHSKAPQCGHGASPGGLVGSIRTSWPQTGQWLSSPSGVRDDGCVFMLSVRRTYLINR
jgi:hypothetical protein